MRGVLFILFLLLCMSLSFALPTYPPVPSAPSCGEEICRNGIDDDCDLRVDEGCSSRTSFRAGSGSSRGSLNDQRTEVTTPTTTSLMRSIPSQNESPLEEELPSSEPQESIQLLQRLTPTLVETEVVSTDADEELLVQVSEEDQTTRIIVFVLIGILAFTLVLLFIQGQTNTKNIHHYIHLMRQQGHEDYHIKQHLKRHGWPEKHLRRHFK